MNWQVYIILCSDDSLYTGISTDVERRFRQHRDGGGAKYFRGRLPLRVVYREDGHDRSSASRREIEIKRMPATEKRQLVAAFAAAAGVSLSRDGAKLR
ncbi:putative endonuclease [Malonomonas rubra DSM 5091]|uniref:Putative endonuclease n=1 Tax=Malonomonas rubra DSM 5091 TaxID=1122189 RepID=A0A1M6JET9_MALRU|nr:GIY-YIG nuclease family protein [Malonomonas rubra]SHJ45211.1 putative endonuclease [Malonomonas rubra DSM 5091]